MNMVGVIIQMTILAVAIVRGRVQDHSALEVVLQSDAVVHARSSWHAGMVLGTMHEKAYREAFGETYLSMTIAVVAVFTVPLRYRSDCVLFVASIGMSLTAVVGGVAEALEYNAATQESDACQILVPNDFEDDVELPPPEEVDQSQISDFFMKPHASSFSARMIKVDHHGDRSKFKTDRHLWVVSILRAAEALSPSVTVAVCAVSSSMRITGIYVMMISTCTFTMPLLYTYMADIVQTGEWLYKIVVGETLAAWRRGCGDLACQLLLLLFLLASAFVVVASMFVVSPLCYLMLYPLPISSAHPEHNQPVKENPFNLINNFRNFMIGKCILLIALWSLLGLSLIAPAHSHFQFYDFVSSLVEDVRRSWPHVDVKGATAAVQLGLMFTALLGIFAMLFATVFMHQERCNWSKLDERRARKCMKFVEKMRLEGIAIACKLKDSHVVLRGDLLDAFKRGSQIGVEQIFARKLKPEFVFMLEEATSRDSNIDRDLMEWRDLMEYLGFDEQKVTDTSLIALKSFHRELILLRQSRHEDFKFELRDFGIRRDEAESSLLGLFLREVYRRLYGGEDQPVWDAKSSNYDAFKALLWWLAFRLFEPSYSEVWTPSACAADFLKLAAMVPATSHPLLQATTQIKKNLQQLAVLIADTSLEAFDPDENQGQPDLHGNVQLQEAYSRLLQAEPSEEAGRASLPGASDLEGTADSDSLLDEIRKCMKKLPVQDVKDSSIWKLPAQGAEDK
eukprot:TRINITY_DN4176_c0_g2_i5.p1 TRINITY_DN4176_c0_g2~~TRINITY_DN4176_c0_g2_i5.p1  ORF type:complete len:736 (+),score=131.21 TRINITY_DN4176_c0_g2_i5:1413-3620(+)